MINVKHQIWKQVKVLTTLKVWILVRDQVRDKVWIDARFNIKEDINNAKR